MPVFPWGALIVRARGDEAAHCRHVANADQIRLWNEVNAPRWLRLREPTTRALVPWGNDALEALSPQRGERALDVGCGYGDTTVQLARRTGDALGVDVCEPFLETARAEAIEGARYLLADAQTYRFADEFDLLYSRFGMMFFDDPAAAFANLRSTLRPGARMALAAEIRTEARCFVSGELAVHHQARPAADDEISSEGKRRIGDKPAFEFNARAAPQMRLCPLPCLAAR